MWTLRPPLTLHRLLPYHTRPSAITHQLPYNTLCHTLKCCCRKHHAMRCHTAYITGRRADAIPHTTRADVPMPCRIPHGQTCRCHTVYLTGRRADDEQEKIKHYNIAPLLFQITSSQSLDLRCVLLSDTSTLGAGPKFVQVPTKARLECRTKKSTLFELVHLPNMIK